MGAFWDRATVLKFSRLRLFYGVMFVVALLLTETGRFAYRPHVYRSGLDDFGIADTMGNSMGVITQIFCLLAVMHSNLRQGLRVIAFVVCGYIVYEYLQIILPKGTFDLKDVAATLVGGLLALGILLAGVRLLGNRVVRSAGSQTDDPTSEA